jgi:hypothetical protein
MARKKGTSRCSISVKGVTYDRIRGVVGEKGSISNFCEEVIAEKLGPPTDEDLKKFDQSEKKRIEEQKVVEDKEPKVIENDDMKGYVPPILLF